MASPGEACVAKNPGGSMAYSGKAGDGTPCYDPMTLYPAESAEVVKHGGNSAEHDGIESANDTPAPGPITSGEVHAPKP